MKRWLLAILVPGLLVASGCGGSNPPVTASNDSAAAPAAPPGPPPGPPAAVPGPPAAVPGPPALQPGETQPEAAAPTPEEQPPAAEPSPPAADPNQPETVPGEEGANPPPGEVPPADAQATGALAGAVLDFFNGLAGQPKAPPEGQPAEGQPPAEQPQPANPAADQPNPGENPADNQAEAPAAIPVLELVPEKSRPFVELAMNRALEAYKKKNPSGPADAEEFINKVLKPKGIRLPKLPPGAQFVLDPNSGQLMIQPGAPAPAGEAAPGIAPAKGARKSIE